MKTLQELAADIRDGLNGVTMALDCIDAGENVGQCLLDARSSVNAVILAVDQMEGSWRWRETNHDASWDARSEIE